MSRRTKDKFIGLFVDDQLYKVIKNRANMLNISVSELLRMILIQVFTKDANYVKINDKKIIEINVDKIYLVTESD